MKNDMIVSISAEYREYPPRPDIFPSHNQCPQIRGGLYSCEPVWHIACHSFDKGKEHDIG